MKAMVIGVKRMFGTSKTGNQFDMASVSILSPISQTTGKITVQGFGHEVTEIACDNAAIQQFANLSFPGTYDLQLDQRPNRGNLENVCVGIVSLAKAA